MQQFKTSEEKYKKLIKNETRVRKNIPESAKRRSWIFLLVIASIIYTTYTKLTGYPFAH